MSEREPNPWASPREESAGPFDMEKEFHKIVQEVADEWVKGGRGLKEFQDARQNNFWIGVSKQEAYENQYAMTGTNMERVGVDVGKKILALLGKEKKSAKFDGEKAFVTIFDYVEAILSEVPTLK